MEKDNEFNLDSQNQLSGVDEIDFSNPDAAKEAYQKAFESHQRTSESNKQLYSRAKKAEGFELKEGKWVKPEVKPKETYKPEKEPSKPSDDLDYGEKAYLRSAIGLKGADELQLAKEWKAKYQSTAEEMESDEVFLARLDKLRKARASDEATPKGGRSASPKGDEFASAMAKYMDTGELPEDRELREKVVEARIAKESSNKMFYNQ